MEFVSVILEKSKKEQEWKNLKKSLDSSFEKMKQKQLSYDLRVLTETLKPKLHALGICYLLASKAAARNPDKCFIPAVEAFLSHFPDGVQIEQVRLGSKRFVDVIHRYTEIMREEKLYNQALSFIGRALKSFQVSPEFLTPLHADYLSICLKAKNYQAGFELIEQQVISVDPSRTGMQTRDLLLFYYYGGMIHIGLQNFVQAEKFFSIGLSIPDHGLNAISIAIYAKFILVSLLNHGELKSKAEVEPNWKPPKSLFSHCENYIMFARTYKDGTIQSLKNIVKEHHQQFQDDKNIGLINQCLTAKNRRNIKQLTSTYLTLSLEDLAKHANLNSVKDAESMLLQMIDSGEIAARINQKDGTIIFLQQNQGNSDIKFNLRGCIHVSKKLRDVDKDIVYSETFICKSMGITPEELKKEKRKQSVSLKSYATHLFGQ